MDEKKFKKINLQYFKGGDDLDNILEALKKAVFSYVVVFASGKFFENLKKFLRF